MGVIGRITGFMLRTDSRQITTEILSLIARIDEFKGAWRALGTLASDRLSALRRVAAIESIGSRSTSSVKKSGKRFVKTPFRLGRPSAPRASSSRVTTLIHPHAAANLVPENPHAAKRAVTAIRQQWLLASLPSGRCTSDYPDGVASEGRRVLKSTVRAMPMGRCRRDRA